MSCDKCMHGNACDHTVFHGDECEYFREKPSPEDLAKSLGICAEDSTSCKGCVLERHDYVFSCRSELMRAAAEYLREKYVPEEWVEDEDFYGDTVYRCPKCGDIFYLEGGTPDDGHYNYCPNCGKRLKMPEEDGNETD